MKTFFCRIIMLVLVSLLLFAYSPKSNAQQSSTSKDDCYICNNDNPNLITFQGNTPFIICLKSGYAAPLILIDNSNYFIIDYHQESECHWEINFSPNIQPTKLKRLGTNKSRISNKYIFDHLCSDCLKYLKKEESFLETKYHECDYIYIKNDGLYTIESSKQHLKKEYNIIIE